VNIDPGSSLEVSHSHSGVSDEDRQSKVENTVHYIQKGSVTSIYIRIKDYVTPSFIDRHKWLKLHQHVSEFSS
jgi:hypothetical protein